MKPWSVGWQQKNSVHMKPTIGWVCKIDNKANGPGEVLLVSDRNLPVASRAGAKGNFGIKPFHPEIGGHVLTPKIRSICGTLGFRHLLRKAEVSVELASQNGVRIG